MEPSRQCRVCGEYGCTSSNHKRCSICSKRGHTKTTCKNVMEPEKSSIQCVPIPPGFTLRRETSATLTQEEIDMAARVYLGCLQEEEDGTATGSFNRACILTGLGRRTMLEISQALKDGRCPQAKESGRGQWERSTPRHILTYIHKTIEKLHGAGIMTSIRKIQEALDFHHGIQVTRRLLSCILQKVGYKYTRPSPNHISLAKETHPMQQYRLKYLKAIKAARKHRTIVYIDESYINQNHHAAKSWLRQDSKVLIPSGKGPRYILYGAGCKHGWIGKPAVFKHRSSHTDYHDGMNADHFEELFSETCVIAAESCGPCLFVLDNASYHKRLTTEKDTLGYWNRLPATDIKTAWSKGEVPGQENYAGPPVLYKKQIIEWLRKNPPSGVCRVKAIANDFGHDVLLLPPYRPELNAIEKAWGVAKNYVGRNNNPSINAAGLLDIIGQGLKEVTESTWSKLDELTAQEEDEQLQVLQDEENRLQKFRDDHPDLVFVLSGSSDESNDETVDDATHQDIIDELEDGLAGSIPCEVHDDNHAFIRGGVNLREKAAVEGLLALCSTTEE